MTERKLVLSLTTFKFKMLTFTKINTYSVSMYYECLIIYKLKHFFFDISKMRRKKSKSSDILFSMNIISKKKLIRNIHAR